MFLPDDQQETATKLKPNETVVECSRLSRGPISLRFRSYALEANFMKEVAIGRLPVLITIAAFDVFLLLLRIALKAFLGDKRAFPSRAKPLWHQSATLLALHTLIAVIHVRSKQSGAAASQGEVAIAGLISSALCTLIVSRNAPDQWIFVAFFLICVSTLLRLRWFVGATALALPVILAGLLLLDMGGWIQQGLSTFFLASPTPLPASAVVQLAVAWAVGALMGFLADSSRREAFANHHRALTAASAELAEMHARIAAERELALAQASAKAKAVLVERERAANEAKSEFISMLCHEIRTPLNGCLASAEMLLETKLNTDQRELAHTVRISGSILLSTVSNFLDYFKLEAGKPLDVVRTPLDLPSMVGDVHRIIEAMMANDGDVQLLEPDLSQSPGAVLGDPSRLCGILLNIYMNAAKFTKRGSIGLKVHAVSQEYRPLPSRANSSWREGRQAQQNGVGLAADRRHDSAESLQPASPDASSAPSNTAMGTRMRVQDEGDGWMGTVSEPPCRMSNKNEHSAGSATTVSARENKNLQWIAFEVHDTGVGVPPRSMYALFKDFVQGDVADMENEKPRTRSGTGLGLAICSRQVAVLGGCIGALSKPGCGSVFWFKIPLAVAVEEVTGTSEPSRECKTPMRAEDLKNCKDDADAASGLEKRASKDREGVVPMARLSPSGKPMQRSGSRGQLDSCLGRQWQAGTPMATPSEDDTEPEKTNLLLSGVRVLLVEDNMINRKVASRVLQSLGAVCDTATNGQEAVDAVNAALSAGGLRWDIVLMDMCMPVLGGVQATAAIRKMGCTLPIVAMTANALEKDREECLNAGMDGFLSKPVLREQLAGCIQDTLQLKINDTTE